MLCIQIVALSAVAVVPVCADAARVVPMCNMFMLCIQMLCVLSDLRQHFALLEHKIQR